MSFESFVKGRLAALTAQYNALTTNAKKIDELPVQSVLDPSSKIHVSKQGESESLEVQQIINAIKNNEYDQILYVDEIVIVDNEVTVPTGLRWKINEIYFETIADVVKAVPFCATGLTRTDILIANALGEVEIIYGQENDTIAIRPNIPVDTVLITEINVTDTVIDDVIPPIIGDTFIPKLPVMINQQLIAYVKDDGTIGRLLPQAYPNLDELAHVKGVTGPIQTQIDDTLTTANAYTDSKVSAVYRIKGSVANYASLPSTGQVVGDVWNLLDTGANYVWTGTDWDKLGDTVDVSGKENTSNKIATVTGNETSTSLYLNILGAVTYFQQKLTDSIFGAFIIGLTTKATPIDADSISIIDSADSNKAKKTTFTQLKAFYKTYFDTQYIAVLSVKVPKTYFINTATGDNATGVYEDASKPFASIDYVTALPSYAGGTIFLQNAGTFAINNTLPCFDVSFKSDVAAEIVLSSMTTTFIAAPYGKNVTFDMPLGKITNNKSGAAGTSIYDCNVVLNVREIYQFASNALFSDVRYFDSKISVLSVGVAGLISTPQSVILTRVREIAINQIVCLQTNSRLLDSFEGRMKISIGLISGSGSFRFYAGKWDIGNITTTGVCTIYSYASGGYTHLNFRNSVITTSGGIQLAGLINNIGTIITGNIISCPSISGIVTGSSNTGITKFLNFSANLGTGTFALDYGTTIFESCVIKSTNSPITLTNGAAPNAKVEILSSTFEVVNAVPLITGGVGGSNTVKIAGLSTNATEIADEEGTGVTITVIPMAGIAGGSGTFKTGRIIVNHGQTSFTTPSDITTTTVFDIELIGAGGGGGTASASSGGAAAGGGGGAYLFKRITGLSPNTSYACVIGTGGTTMATGLVANAGTATTLTIAGVTYTSGGGGGGTGAANSSGGAGGTATNGDLNIPGESGADSGPNSTASQCGKGGSSGRGFGAGGREVANNVAGENGRVFGGGASAGHGSNQVGGTGANGIIICTWYNQ